MSDRIKRMAIGFGLIFVLQLAVAAAASRLFRTAGDDNNIAGIPLIFTIAINFGAGLVMGLLAKKFIWVEPFVVAMLAVLLNVLFYFTHLFPDLTLIAVSLSSKSPIIPLLINFGVLTLSAIFGDLLGVRMQQHYAVDEEISISPEHRKILKN